LRDELETLLVRGYRYGLSLTHDPDRAEDLLQDAWVSVLKARGPREIGYLFAAIRSRFVDQTRRKRIELVEALPPEELERIADDERSWQPEISLGSKDLEAALAKLRPEEREILFLQAVEGFTAKEIGELTGRPRGTVLSLLHRTRKKLVRALGEPRREAKP